jgi:hypothetical protein
MDNQIKWKNLQVVKTTPEMEERILNEAKGFSADIKAQQERMRLERSLQRVSDLLNFMLVAAAGFIIAVAVMLLAFWLTGGK